jgi:cell division protein FtsA
MIDKHLLALDVGTRKVTGLLLESHKEGFDILAVGTLEHRTRAMLGGQIHDIPKVAAVVSAVHKSLEEKCGCRIHSAAVAAAGRSLHTVRGQAAIQISSSSRLKQDDILRLEYSAVQQAQQQLFAGPAGRARFAEQYHCVGYSVVRYTLDDSPIGNLFGQRGGLAACEVIATFLPRVVVDSLRSVLELSGLKLQSLTLEPIAALRMVVPPEMRRLNVALVDIGAGTSDIAITRESAVFAYGMVPAAGDEITEAITEQFLLDFMTAEKVKRQINNNGNITFTNIMGEKITMAADELRSAVAPALDVLTENIARAILESNGTAPQAVFCVGGGSLTAGLTAALAEKLGMDAGRVAIKGKEMVNLLPGKTRKYQGPELVTPLGIAYTGVSGDALQFYRVEVNKEAVDVMDLGRSRVSDALLAAGTGSRELVGPPGKGISVEVNGHTVAIPGEMGSMAEIRVNGKVVTLEDKISEGDKISFTAAKRGEDACANVAMLLARTNPFCVTVNGTEHQLQKPVYRGGELLMESAQLFDRDKLRLLKTMPLSWVLGKLNMADYLAGGYISVILNGEEKSVPYGPRVIRINGKPAVPESEVSDGDILQAGSDGAFPTVGGLTEERTRLIEINVNDKLYNLPVTEVTFIVNDREVPAEAPLHAGDNVEIKRTDHEVTMAVILNLINFEATPPTGQNKLVLRVNGREAQFTTFIKHADRLEVGWSA